MKIFSYKFSSIDQCNMCMAPSTRFKFIGRRLNQSQGFRPLKKEGITTGVYRCKNCGLIFSNPLPQPENISDHYGIPPENYWKDEYFRLDDSYFKSEIERFKTLAKFEVGMKALDIGAGLGKAMLALTHAGFDSYGFEPSKPFYERAIQKMGVSPEKLKLGPIEEMKYPANYFDFISFGAVLEHLADPSEAIKKAMKWLKPGGVIQIEVPSSDWLIHKILNFYYKMLGSGFVANLSPMHSPFHLYEFSLKSFQEHAQANNYVIGHYEYYVCNTYLPKPMDFLFRKLMKQNDSGMQLVVWLKKKGN